MLASWIFGEMHTKWRARTRRDMLELPREIILGTGSVWVGGLSAICVLEQTRLCLKTYYGLSKVTGAESGPCRMCPWVVQDIYGHSFTYTAERTITSCLFLNPCFCSNFYVILHYYRKKRTPRKVRNSGEGKIDHRTFSIMNWRLSKRKNICQTPDLSELFFLPLWALESWTATETRHGGKNHLF
jgi:hypothetical protein